MESPGNTSSDSKRPSRSSSGSSRGVWTPATAAGHVAKINRTLEEVTGRATSYTLNADLYKTQYMVTCWCKEQVLGKRQNLERHAAL